MRMESHRSFTRSLAATAILVLALAGCGGQGTTPAVGSAPLRAGTLALTSVTKIAALTAYSSGGFIDFSASTTTTAASWTPRNSGTESTNQLTLPLACSDQPISVPASVRAGSASPSPEPSPTPSSATTNCYIVVYTDGVDPAIVAGPATTSQDGNLVFPQTSPGLAYNVSGHYSFFVAILPATSACTGGTPTTLAGNFNGTAIAAGDSLWLSSVMKLQGATGAKITMTGSTFTIDGVPYAGPNSTVTFSPATTSATTTFDGTAFATASSTSFAGNTLLNGLTIPLPTGLAGSKHSVAWTGTFYSSVSNVKLSWQWAGAAYTQFGDYGSIGVKASDDAHATGNSDHAGTPEAFKSYVTGGATGGGGSNYTGSYSPTLAVTPTLCTV